jgi:hypothetical protein
MSDMNLLIDELNSGTTIFPGGMPSFFRCKIEVVAKQEITQKAGIEQYENHGLTLAKSMDPREVDVVLCHIPRTSEFFYMTPYYRLKAIFAYHGFSSQMVTPYAFKNLKWSHLNLATAIFAKAGHIPWVLGNELSADMILGVNISNVVAKHTRAGGFRRFIGYVNVFDSFGRWLFFEGLAQPYAKEEMSQSLQRLLTSAVLKYQAIKHTDPMKISIYLWKKASNEDRRVSEKAIHDIVSGCSVMFISVDSSHPFRLFDLSTIPIVILYQGKVKGLALILSLFCSSEFLNGFRSTVNFHYGHRGFSDVYVAVRVDRNGVGS